MVRPKGGRTTDPVSKTCRMVSIPTKEIAHTWQNKGCAKLSKQVQVLPLLAGTLGGHFISDFKALFAESLEMRSTPVVQEKERVRA